jgi:putative transposase
VFEASGKVKFSGINVEVKTKLTEFEQIDCARIIPKDGYYVIEVVHSEACADKLEDNERYIGIDLGVSNFATVTSNVKEITPFIINGRPLKSMNQFYNKRMARYTSILEKTNKKKTSIKTKKLILKRKNKIDNYMHRASKKIVSFCIENNINSIVVGKNDGWKQDVNTGHQNNQAFVNIPHSRFIEMLSYKCELKGISFIANEESYTSKASFLNLDQIPIYKKGENKDYEFSGYRKSRGLYKLKDQNKTINADVNGSYNILRKAFPTAFANGIEGVGVRPKLVHI